MIKNSIPATAALIMEAIIESVVLVIMLSSIRDNVIEIIPIANGFTIQSYTSDLM